MHAWCSRIPCVTSVSLWARLITWPLSQNSHCILWGLIAADAIQPAAWGGKNKTHTLHYALCKSGYGRLRYHGDGQCYCHFSLRNSRGEVVLMHAWKHLQDMNISADRRADELSHSSSTDSLTHSLTQRHSIWIVPKWKKTGNWSLLFCDRSLPTKQTNIMFKSNDGQPWVASQMDSLTQKTNTVHRGENCSRSCVF